MRKTISERLQEAQAFAIRERQAALARRDANRAVQEETAREARGGLVPYITSQTGASGPASAAFAVQTLPWISSLEARLARMKHHVRTAARLVKETMSRDGRQWRALFVTLTYRPGVEWSPGHIAAYLDALRKWGGREGFAPGYVWVAEMQRRGAVHYHIVVWVRRGVRLPRPDRPVRPWWPHGASNVKPVQRNAIGYLMKYVSKGVGADDPELPKGLRVCGSGGLDKMARGEFHYWRLPRYVREKIELGQRCTRAAGGGWLCRETGEIHRTDWGLFGVAFRSREADCNGRPRRADTVCILSDQWKRVVGAVGIAPEVVSLWAAVVREQAQETFEAICADLPASAVRWGWEA